MNKTKKKKKDYLTLVEIQVVKSSSSDFAELDNLCWLSKNLYNATLYAVRQQYFNDGTYLNYNAVNRLFTHSKQADYIALPAKVSKITQHLVEQNYQSFFALLKKSKTNPELGLKPRPPRYLNVKKGRQVVFYEQGALSFKRSGFIRLSKTNIYIPTAFSKEQVQFVRVVHCGNHIKLEIGYRVKHITTAPLNPQYAAIDIGLNNLVALAGEGLSPCIINGRPLKSINQYFNKQKAKAQSELSGNRKTSKRIKTLGRKRHFKIKDYLHKCSRHVVNYLVSNQITDLVVGRNKGWKQNINIGKKNNQNFTNIPISMFTDMLVYKCQLAGIRLHFQEESYTSKCSFFDNETVKKQKTYQGKRVKRGLFKTATGKCVNADVNGALNILKKYLTIKEAWNDQIWSDLVEVYSTPHKVTVR